MSSVGPSIAIVTARSEPEMRELLTPMGLTLALRTYVDNEGMQIRM